MTRFSFQTYNSGGFVKYVFDISVLNLKTNLTSFNDFEHLGQMYHNHISISDCETLTIEGGILSTDVVSHGTVVVLTCKAGFLLVGEHSLTECNNGLWSPVLGTCQPGSKYTFVVQIQTCHFKCVEARKMYK